MRLYKGCNKGQLINMLADYSAFKAKVNNKYNQIRMNESKISYVNLYKEYPMVSKLYPAFSLSVMYDNMIHEIEEAKEISKFNYLNNE